MFARLEDARPSTVPDVVVTGAVTACLAAWPGPRGPARALPLHPEIPIGGRKSGDPALYRDRARGVPRGAAARSGGRRFSATAAKVRAIPMQVPDLPPDE